MQIFKRDKLGMLLLEARKSGGAFVGFLKNRKIKVHLEIKRYKKGSRLFHFNFGKDESSPSNLTREMLNEIFCDINKRKEFNELLEIGRNYCRIWIDEDEESMKQVVEHVLGLKYGYGNF